jgi:uncharacterized protein
MPYRHATPSPGHSAPSNRRQTALLFGLLALLLASVASAGIGQALVQAAADGRWERVAIFLDQGARPDTRQHAGEHAGKTALMWAAEHGAVDAVQQLLAHGASVDLANPKGGTALMYAAAAGREAVIAPLIAAGADPNRQVRHGWSPLMLATVKGHTGTVAALLANGAYADSRDVYGWTLLMHAVHRGDPVTARLLLDAGADPHAAADSGHSAVDLATALGDRHMLGLLTATP